MYKDQFRPSGEQNLFWNMYGQGIENIGQDGKPEAGNIPTPGPDQILVRVDAVGMCFSDVKLIRQGRKHPKLYNRDLTQEPTRLGHEVSVTVAGVGENLADQFSIGQRFAIQPDIYQNGRSTAYGYTVPGGLIQYHLIGAEVLDTDAGACMLPLEGDMGYAESALLEPWGCVVAAYTQRRRLEPLEGGIMWIIGRPGDETAYSFEQYLDRPDRIILTNCPPSLATTLESYQDKLIVRDDLSVDEYRSLSNEFTNGKGFDDIVVLDPRSGEAVAEIARHIARRGTMNLVGQEPLDSLSASDVGRLHYDYIAFVGQQGPEISDSYGEARNRCDLRPNGSTVIVGAGGPMGQMHLQRALELPNGPKKLVVTDINQMRLDAIGERFGPLAQNQGRELILYNPTAEHARDLVELVMELTDNEGADDVIISVPAASLMEEGGRMMKSDGMLVLFAGVPNGTEAPLDLSKVYLSNAQYTGTSGLTLNDQRLVMQRSLDGELSPEFSVAAIGGMNAAIDGIEAMMSGRFPGKIVIFPQVEDLPLTGLDQLSDVRPDIAKALGEGNSWTQTAEDLLLE